MGEDLTVLVGKRVHEVKLQRHQALHLRSLRPQ